MPEWRQLLAIVGLGFRRVVGRLTGSASGRVLLSAAGVAIAVMLMTSVSGVALGLASQSTVESDNVDYWVLPEANGGTSSTLSVGGPQLGDVHATTARLAADDRIDFVTPVQLRVVNMEAQEGNSSEYILAIGVIPREGSQSVGGLPLNDLQPGDPHYANGSYSGPWTGEIVFSQAASELLGVSTGDNVVAQSSGTSRSLSVTNVSQASLSSGAGPLPVAVMHLSELQTLAGGTEADLADQILVSTDDPSVKSDLEESIAGATVVSGTGVSTQSVSTSSLALAVALTAFVTAVVVGVLFVATMMGLEILASRAELAVLTAVGYSQRSQALLVLTETVAVSVVGGIAGVGLGAGAIVVFNRFAAQSFGVDSLAQFDPLLVVYGIVVAVLIGLIAAPYPIWLSRRTDVTEVLG